MKKVVKESLDKETQDEIEEEFEALKEQPQKFYQKSKRKIVFLVIGLILCVLALAYLWLRPRMVLKGDQTIEINYQEQYKEQGAYFTYFFHKDQNVEISGKVDSDRLGTYKISYSYKKGILKGKATRIVKVVDQEAPKITLTGGTHVLVCPNQKYNELGYDVTDNYDQDLKDQVKITELEKEQKIKYEVEDQAHNKAVIVRSYEYKDETSPTLTLKGSAEETMYVGQKYIEDGYEAVDQCDGDLSSKVTIDGTVDTSRADTYTLVYKVEDAAGNLASVSRTVKVTVRPDAGGSGNGIVYLTFDDGPSSTITPQVLDILKDEGVKATFFVINHSDSLNYLIKRAYDEGHTIALHSYSHVYSSVYSSVDAYFQDLEAIGNKVQSIIGFTPRIIRFPGGSSNTVSRKYVDGIMTTLTEEVLNRGYHYFDWNVSSGDAGDVDTKEGVYNSVVSGLSHSKTNVVLMHDYENNYKTVEALRDIIHYAKNQGYSFAPIDFSTPIVRHRVNN